VRAPEEAQEDDAAAPVVVGQAQQRPEEAVDDLRGLQRLARRRPLHLVENAQPLVVEPVQAAPEHLLHQRLLGPEVVIDGSQIHCRVASDLAHRRSLVTVRHEQALGRIENALAGIDIADFWHRPCLLRERLIHTFVLMIDEITQGCKPTFR